MLQRNVDEGFAGRRESPHNCCPKLTPPPLSPSSPRLSFYTMSKRILLVDDELDFTMLLQFRLKEWGYHTSVATNGMDGFRKSSEQQPDLIVTDLVLPDLDGLTLCESLRRQAATQATPVFMITASANDATRYSARAAGASDFFCKPLDFERLKQSLDTVLATPVSSIGRWSHRIQDPAELGGWLERANLLRGALTGRRSGQPGGSGLDAGGS